MLQAADGEEALAVAREHRPDLILLDVMMPKLDGNEVCRRLKNDATLPFTPIILVTAKAESGDVVAGLEAGADEYLTKPIDQKALVARVKALLRIKERHDRGPGANERHSRTARFVYQLFAKGRCRQSNSLTAYPAAKPVGRCGSTRSSRPARRSTE